ncbi:hypothetical protein VPNG_05338 [Cytospora leucostoma]|uniref:HIT-type domain-containing protein n=1 Tax=Cytospora leucostoma TaxID=1230097 RepID=A0A423X4P7_9PEZI|nr:hypothetical protein VPNG_05338 [Cytospora leucostoma]
MNNFGVIEVASAKTTHAPGWAYVPDTPTSAIPSQSVSAVHLHVNRKKRAARNAADSSSATVQEGISARHSAKVQKEIEQLQRDSIGGRDGHVPIPSGGRDKDGKIRGHTPNVRKILASQKTFANHLDDFEAWSRTQAQSEGPQRSHPHSMESTPAPGSGTATGGGGNRRAAGAAQKRGSASAAAAARGKTPATKKSATPIPVPTPDPDVDMTDAPPGSTTIDQADPAAPHTEPDSQILTPYTRFTPQPCHGDSDPLLESWLPPLPTDQELRELVRAPPLNYNQARGVWTADGKRYPPRQFCEVCGYWGRVRCMKCGTRVCALDCMDVHREECITRYGL